ncbi:tubulin epsilon and delta complex protein 2 [Astyanax mexicanus]|uniref:tubulin epsilon and delta complex protein 2 n=1 Tax=Astyanax mexicanus TaxID=7994 RepID=UPI0020CB3DC2|nr:tubulin epsilon and delta complex protein 2 [Astyanax mexicanus]XP_049323602.1 tubulin epsilon and delta complex protein 2 [Astyanax mexicanus]
MSVSLDEVIKMCCTQQAKLTETIKQCRDILHSMKVPVIHISEADRSASVCVKNEDIPVKELQEIDLLEQVLKKAVKVRSSSALLKNHGAQLQEKKPVENSNRVPVSIKTTAKDSVQIKPKKSTQTGPARRGPSAQTTVRAKPLVAKPATVQISSTAVQKSSSQSTDSKTSTEEKIIAGPPTDDMQLKSAGQVSLLKEPMVLSPWFPVWQAQRTKKNRLWNKVLSRHSKPVPERTHFRERLSSTFPKDWLSGQVSVRQAELDSLTQLGLDLSQCYRASLRNQQPLSTRGPGTDPEASLERQYESVLMLQGLERMMIGVIKEGDRLKKESERNTGGALFPVRRRSMWSCLPPLLSYSTEAELEELNTLQLRVNQLQLEIHLHQAMSDTPTHPQCSIPGSLSAASLRGLYSLLGEGGAQFPTLVLDSEPQQT